MFKSLADAEIYRHCRPLVLGDIRSLSLWGKRTPRKINRILDPAQALYRAGTIDVLIAPLTKTSEFKLGRPSAQSGRISYGLVRLSVDLAKSGAVQGLVHAPISKQAWNSAGIRYDGHTELLADLCGTKNIAMAIASEPLRTVLVTRHIPLMKVGAQVNQTEIKIAVRQAMSWMRAKKIRAPRIGVCALNPHAGEGGMFGKEEIQLIAPAVRALKKEFGSAQIIGPLPADSAYRDHRAGIYDCLITQYHDQSLIPLKLFNSKRLVNISLGLPFPRTSPGHGTAFDIAGLGRADPSPMKEAILTAANLCAS